MLIRLISQYIAHNHPYVGIIYYTFFFCMDGNVTVAPRFVNFLKSRMWQKPLQLLSPVVTCVIFPCLSNFDIFKDFDFYHRKSLSFEIN